MDAVGVTGGGMFMGCGAFCDAELLGRATGEVMEAGLFVVWLFEVVESRRSAFLDRVVLPPVLPDRRRFPPSYPSRSC
jgi:hypothetical protein